MTNSTEPTDPNKADEKSSLLTFPCDFPIKVIGEVSVQFEADVLNIARRHHPELQESAIQRKTSKQGNFLAISITVQATSQATLDALYEELSKHPDTKLVL